MSCRCSWARSNISLQHTLQTHNLKVRRTHTSLCHFFLCTHIRTRCNLSVLMRRGNCDGLRDRKSLMSRVYLSEEPKWTQDNTDEIIAGDLPSVWSEQKNWKAAFHQMFSTLQWLHCTTVFFSVVYVNAIHSFITLALCCWYLTTHCRDLQGTIAIQSWPQRGWNQDNSSWNSLWKRLVRGKQWWEKKRRQLWPAIQLPLSFLCLTHHTQLITAIHSTVCLRHQTTITARSIIWEQTFLAKLSTFVHTKPFFPVCFLVTLWHSHFFSLLR